MAEFQIYTVTVCSYCTAAKGWLLNKGHSYVERNIETDPTALVEMQRRAPGKRTAPQIFLGSYQIGGYTDLMESAQNGTLEMLLAAPL